MSIILGIVIAAVYVGSVLIFKQIFKGASEADFISYVKHDFPEMKITVKRASSLVKIGKFIFTYTPFLNTALLLTAFIYAFIKVVILQQEDY